MGGMALNPVANKPLMKPDQSMIDGLPKTLMDAKQRNHNAVKSLLSGHSLYGRSVFGRSVTGDR